jgi:hypothetical protein
MTKLSKDVFKCQILAGLGILEHAAGVIEVRVENVLSNQSDISQTMFQNLQTFI